MRQFIANFILFQLSWLALVGGAGRGLLWPGLLLSSIFLAWELSISQNRKGLCALLALGLVGGVIVDGSYASFNIIDYAMPAGPLAPWWIMGLWLIFSLTLPQSMAWMRSRPIIGSLMAGVAAPMSYIAGLKLGAVTFPLGFWPTFAITAATWIPAIYIMVLLSIRLIPQTNAEFSSDTAHISPQADSDHRTLEQS
ncbi:MAG: DUF2878 domain-containing protein [Pseudomonadota bacterium]